MPHETVGWLHWVRGEGPGRPRQHCSLVTPSLSLCGTCHVFSALLANVQCALPYGKKGGPSSLKRNKSQSFRRQALLSALPPPPPYTPVVLQHTWKVVFCFSVDELLTYIQTQMNQTVARILAAVVGRQERDSGPGTFLIPVTLHARSGISIS